MSFTVRHVQQTLAGGVPLPTTPDGAAYDTAARINAGVFIDAPCPGTGAPSGTYPKTIYLRTDSAQWYDYSINGGPFTASTMIPGNPPVTGVFDWQLTLQLPLYSMTARTSNSITIRVRPIADVAAVTYTIGPFNLFVERCARPVGLSIAGCAYNGCDTDRCTVSWSSTAANVASSTYVGVPVPSTGSAIVVNDPGTKAYNWQSISGVAADGSTGTISVDRSYSTDCSTGNPACPRLDCLNVCGGTAMRDCAGVCNGSSVIDCTGACTTSPAPVDCAGVCNGSGVDLPCPTQCNGETYCSTLGDGSCPTTCPCSGGGSSSYQYQCMGGTLHIIGGGDPPGCSSGCMSPTCEAPCFGLTFPGMCPTITGGDTLIPCGGCENQNIQHCA